MALPAGVTITQITAAGTTDRSHGQLAVYGLGSDQNVYTWDNAGHEWRLWA